MVYSGLESVCVESLGGISYRKNLEDGGAMKTAHLLGHSAMDGVWEGTTDVLAEDFVRVTKGRTGEQVVRSLDTLVVSMTGTRSAEFEDNSRLMQSRWGALKAWLSSTATEEVLYQGCEVLQRVQELICSLLLMIHARSTGNSLGRTIVQLAWRKSGYQHEHEVLSKAISASNRGRLPVRAALISAHICL